MALQVWLPLNGNLNNQGLSNYTIINNETTVDNNGKIGKCYSFNGTSKYLRINEKVITTSQYSIAFWMYMTDVSGNRCIFSTRNVNSGAVNVYALPAGIRFDTSTTANWQTGFKPSANTWYHITLVQDATTKYLYVNGVLNTSIAGTTDLTQVSSVCTIGCEHINGSSIGTYYIGKLNDFRIYDRALAPREIEILSRGLVCHYPLNGGGRGGDNIISGTSPNEVQYTYPSSSYSDKFSKTSTIIPSASQYVLSFWAKSTHAGDKVRAHWYSPNTTTKSETNQGSISTAADGQIDFTLSDKWEKYWCVWTQSSTTAVKHFIFPRMFSQANGEATGTGTVSVKCVKLEEGNIPTPWMPNSADTAYSAMGYNSTTEYDVSGYGYNGTKTGTFAYDTDTVRYSVSTIFKNASSNYITLSPINVNMTQVSFSVWFKINSAQKWTRIFDFGTAAEGAGYSFGLALGNNGTTLTVYGRRGSSSATLPDKQVQSISLNTWYHAVVTLSNTTLKCYINGTLVIDTTITAAYPSSVAFTLCYLGKSIFSADKLLDGTVSDFRAYATALSATQVAELYNTAVSVANNGTLMGYELVEV